MAWMVGNTVNSYVRNLVRCDALGVPLKLVTSEDRVNSPSGLFSRYFQDRKDPAGAPMLDPTYLKLPPRKKTIPDLLTGHGGSQNFRVSDKVRRTVEIFEPGQHYFFRVNILNADLKPWHEQYWAMFLNRSAVFQALIVEQSQGLEWEPMATPYGPYTRRLRYISIFKWAASLTVSAVNSCAGFVLDQNAFEGRHIVLEDIHRNESRTSTIAFFSDALVKALKAKKVKGFKLGKVKTAARLVPAYGQSNGNGAVA